MTYRLKAVAIGIVNESRKVIFTVHWMQAGRPVFGCTLSHCGSVKIKYGFSGGRRKGNVKSLAGGHGPGRFLFNGKIVDLAGIPVPCGVIVPPNTNAAERRKHSVVKSRGSG